MGIRILEGIKINDGPNAGTAAVVQEAPEQSCAYAGCQSSGYLQVQDLGRWVWVCQQHLPAHAQPLLPTDNNLDNWSSQGADEERCPSCNETANSAGSSVRDMEGHQVHRCGSCSTLWVRETPPEGEEPGIWGGEIIERLASVLETIGQQAQAFAGRTIWQSLFEVFGSSLQQTGVAGVPVRMHTGNPMSVVLLGARPQTNVNRGVQRLGGQPDRQSPSQSIPEEGSTWKLLGSRSKRIFTVERIRYADQPDQPGRRIQIEGIDDKGKAFQVWLDEFLQKYELHRQTEPAIPAIGVPCEIGEEWADSSGKTVKIVDIEAGQIVVEMETGGRALVPTYILSSRYKKVPPRRGALDRLLDDDD